MDQGLAAYYVGIGAFIGTLITAAVSYLAARHSANIAAKASAEQVANQATVERAQWIRQEQRQAYGDVIRAYSQLAHTLARLRVAIHDEAPTGELLDSIDVQQSLLHVACYNTRLFGPPVIADIVKPLAEAGREDAQAHRELGMHSMAGGSPQLAEIQGKVNASRREMGRAFTAFTDAASTVLLGGTEEAVEIRRRAGLER
ncbi:hypothetical protein AB0G60_02830 [Streptomyces angustmyceticus]|uniref:Uncharacterized protein n=1 Tax=Streptomyces angustmyceticus TaxID=285578 RepID=A0A5J4L6S0_9ACTN|nr:hypothetical protein [Streptomyces angustmyceticus]UAL65597.1 hypothetical protein K7396_02800 [Streptomyces angustmyceticus]GES27882.1 hypothetical protein San01_03690 [Streptomyces angustmyceticus]